MEFTDKDFEDNRDNTKRSIKYEIYYNKFGAGVARRVLLEGDPQLTKALDLLPEAKGLASKALRQIAEKRRVIESGMTDSRRLSGRFERCA